MGKARAGSNQQLVRQARWEAVRANWLILLVFACFIGMLCTAVSFLPGGNEWHGFMLGVFTTTGVFGGALVVHLASGSHYRSLGVFGESATADAVCGIWHRLRGWRHIGGLYFQRHGDVDHAVIGPRGVYAIETKWITEQWSIIDGQLVGEHAFGAAPQAAQSAQRLDLALNYGHERLGIDVRPVLFLWGPGAPAIEGGFTDINGVRVVDGRWARLRHHRIFDGDPLSRSKRRAATLMLNDMSKSQRRSKH